MNRTNNTINKLSKIFKLFVLLLLLNSCNKHFIVDKEYISGGGNPSHVTTDSQQVNGIEKNETYIFYNNQDQKQIEAFNPVFINIGHNEKSLNNSGLDGYSNSKCKDGGKFYVSKYLNRRDGFMVAMGILSLIEGVGTINSGNPSGVIMGILMLAKSNKKELERFYIHKINNDHIDIKISLIIMTKGCGVKSDPVIIENLPPDFKLFDVKHNLPKSIKSISYEKAPNIGPNAYKFTIQTVNGYFERNKKIKINLYCKIKFY